MTEETKTLYANALKDFEEARTRLAHATVAYDRERHLARKMRYDMKEAGTRKMTEEQIRSEAVVECQDVYADYTIALKDCEIARERLEFVKTIINS